MNPDVRNMSQQQLKNYIVERNEQEKAEYKEYLKKRQKEVDDIIKMYNQEKAQYQSFLKHYTFEIKSDEQDSDDENDANGMSRCLYCICVCNGFKRKKRTDIQG